MPQTRLGGRPSRETSEQLGALILDAATELFLTHGFGATSIEAVAQRVRISKRTFYHRFEDKPALFAAVVHRIIERLRPSTGIPLIEGADAQVTLERLAALTPQAIALHRMIVAESARFPELAVVVTREGATEEAIKLIAGLLEREAKVGRLKRVESVFAAHQFLQMVIGLPQRRAMGLGAPMSKRELTAWPRKVVDLFLNGCRVEEPTR